MELEAEKASAVVLGFRGNSFDIWSIWFNKCYTIGHISKNVEFVLRIKGKIIMQAPEVPEQDAVVNNR